MTHKLVFYTATSGPNPQPKGGELRIGRLRPVRAGSSDLGRDCELEDAAAASAIARYRAAAPAHR